MTKLASKADTQVAIWALFDLEPTQVSLDDKALVIDLQQEELQMTDMGKVARIMERYWGNVHVGMSYSDDDGILTLTNKGPK